MTRPLIGITTYAPDPGGNIELPRDYADCVRRAGGQAVLVPPGDPRPIELLDRLDGLVLAGGGDIDPSRSGVPRHDDVYGTSLERDDAELPLVRAALADGVPIFAICRGMQVLNVALGGSLHAHLPDVVGDTVAHRLPPREPTPHAVKVEPDALVAEVMGVHEVTTMSWHHQAVDALGEGLRVTARAPDGTIEAVGHDGPGWVLAVQWHPELTAGTDPTQQRLFDALVTRSQKV